MTRLSWTIAAVALAGCLLPRVLEAQVLYRADALQRAQELQMLQPQQTAYAVAPSLYTGEENDSGRQFILAPTPGQRWQWINLTLDSQYFYTSNAYLNDTLKKGTGMTVNSINGALAAPPITVPYGQLFTRAGYEYDWFDYGIGGPGDHFGRLDFDVATVYAQGKYELPGQWTISGNLAYSRLLSEGNDFDEFYKELVPTLGVEKIFQIRDNMQFSLGYFGDYRFTDEVPFPNQGRDCNNRTDQGLDFTLTWQVAPKVIIRPFYLFQYSYYPDYFAGQSRNDLLHTLGLSANYSFNSWSSVRLFLTYEIRDSDASSVPDYHKLDVGGGVSVGLKF